MKRLKDKIEHNLAWVGIPVFIMGFFVTVYAVLTAFDALLHDQGYSRQQWEDSCAVSLALYSAGVQVQCQFGNRMVILVSDQSGHTALVGNTPLDQRSEIPVVCRQHPGEWGGWSTWSCRVGEGDDTFYRVRYVSPTSPAEES